MKKILITIFLILAMSNLYAQEFNIYKASIEELGKNDYFFSLGIQTNVGFVLINLPPNNVAAPNISFYHDSFIEQCFNISNSDFLVYFVVYPISFSFSEKNPSWNPPRFDLTFGIGNRFDPVKNSDSSILLSYGSHTKMVELISALLNDGFVIFDLEFTDTRNKDNEGNYITYSQKYYWNIPDEESRKKALEIFNRYMNFFYE